MLDFGNKLIATILVNAIIDEVSSDFWTRCSLEDAKFAREMVLLNSKCAALETFIPLFLGHPARHRRTRRSTCSDSNAESRFSTCARRSCRSSRTRRTRARCSS